MKAQKLTPKQGIELMKKGNVLTVPGKNLDKLSATDNEKYKWGGLTDQSPTILEESELTSLFAENEWIVNL